jgi:hypothetical protein
VLGSERLQKSLRVLPNKVSGPYAGINLEYYPYGPFYLVWQYKDYNENAEFNNSPFYWNAIDFRLRDITNTFLLTDEHDNHYGFVNKFFTSVIANTDYTKIIVWRTAAEPGKRYIKFSFVDLDKVTRLPYYSQDNIPDKDTDWYFNPEAVTDFEIDIKATTTSYPIEVPEVVRLYFREILITLDIPGIYGEGPPYNNSCLVVINLIDKMTTVYPQDWFNKQHLDFGYQWLLRAKRLQNSSQISVQAMRTGLFILDDTYRDIIKQQ